MNMKFSVPSIYHFLLFCHRREFCKVLQYIWDGYRIRSTDFIVYGLLKLPRSSIVSGHSVLMLDFCIAGLVLAVIDVASGILPRSSGAIRLFFCKQVFGVVLEKIAQSICFSVFGRSQLPIPPALWSGCLGYIWLAIFLSWSVPTWHFPKLYRARSGMRDSVLSSSPLRALLAIQ